MRQLSEKFLKKHKLIYYLPNLFLGKSTLMFWINLVYKLISKRKLSQLTGELKTIIMSLKNIKFSLEEIMQEHKIISKHIGVDAKNLDHKINEIMCKIVMECDDVATVADILNILSELRNESFTKKLSV